MAYAPTFQTWKDDENAPAEMFDEQARRYWTWLKNAPAFFIYNNGGQSLTNTTTAQLVDMDAETFDPFGGHSLTTNSARYTIPFDGIWQFRGSVGFNGNITGGRVGYIYINGTSGTLAGIARSSATSDAALSTVLPVIGPPIRCYTGDYVELYAGQNSGGTLTMLTGGNTYLAGEWVAP